MAADVLPRRQDLDLPSILCVMLLCLAPVEVRAQGMMRVEPFRRPVDIHRELDLLTPQELHRRISSCGIGWNFTGHLPSGDH